MDCCVHTQDISAYFGASKAQSEVKQYLKNGLASHARAMAAAVCTLGVDGAHVLEVGSGVGSLHLELLARGAGRATSVEVSPAYLAAAQSLARQSGVAGRIDYHLLDFACQPDSVPAAEIVIMHRVVCCYPDMPRLIAAGAGHARRALALSFPRDRWYVRLFIEIQAAWLRMKGSSFRNYVRSPAAIVQAANASGLRLIHERCSGTWQIVVFERTA